MCGGLAGTLNCRRRAVNRVRSTAVFYNVVVKSYDVIIVGGGIIGLSLAIALRKGGARVLVVEKGEPGREASHAAAGMLVDCGVETPAALQTLATASARMYREFVHELENESGVRVDLRSEGTILFSSTRQGQQSADVAGDALQNPRELEPALAPTRNDAAIYLKERSVDPRALVKAALKTAKHREVDFSSGDPAASVDLADGRVIGVSAAKTSFSAPIVVNCAGAWSGQLGPARFPTRPVRGQMLAVAAPSRTLLRHVVRAPEIYLVPRSDGRILIGSTVEEAGFDKRTDPDTIHRLHQAAVGLIPELAQARILEDWAGLRPGTPDDLPILGATSVAGYYVATGHFRDGILLAPVTAQLMAQVVMGGKIDYDISAFSVARFATRAA